VLTSTKKQNKTTTTTKKQEKKRGLYNHPALELFINYREHGTFIVEKSGSITLTK
jgi:hypothetical protein